MALRPFDPPPGMSVFAAVNVVRCRADQLSFGSPPRVSTRHGEKTVSIAVRELEAGVQLVAVEPSTAAHVTTASSAEMPEGS